MDSENNLQSEISNGFDTDRKCTKGQENGLSVWSIKESDLQSNKKNEHYGDPSTDDLETDLDNLDSTKGSTVVSEEIFSEKEYDLFENVIHSADISIEVNPSIKEKTIHTTEKFHDENDFKKFNAVCVKIQKENNVNKDLHSSLEHEVSVDEEKEVDTFSQHVNGSPVHKKLHPAEILEWFDNEHQEDTIHRLNVFRKSKQFCDLVLLVGGHEIYCHRVIVGAASRAVFDELSRGEQESGPIARIPCDATRPGLLPGAVEVLIDYMYTSRLVIPPSSLIAVYRAALQLGVERVTPLCRRYVIANSDAEQCIQMRRLAQNCGDGELKQHMDSFIEDNFEYVAASHEFLCLPRIKMEILMSPNASVINLLSVSLRDGMVGSTALAWVFGVIQQRGGGHLEDLTEQIQRVPLEDLNNAASSFSPTHCSGFNRRLSQERDNRKSLEGHPRRLTRSSSMDSLKSSDSGDSSSHICCSPKGEWKVIASTQASGTEHIITLCCLGDVLCTLSIRLPPMGELTNGQETNGFHSNHPSSRSSTSTSCSSSVGSVNQLSSLSFARCAAGMARVGDKIIVAGGFNQAECLDTVEAFDPAANKWTMASRMTEKRARFSVAVLHGKLYAIGGSTGSNDLLLVERYDPEKDTWSHVQSLLFRCSESGVAALNNLLYCVGGVQQSTGVAGMKACQIYDPTHDEWRVTASLQTGRSSLGVAALGGCLYAVGGSDGWKCLGSAEKYDPATEHWTYTAALNVHRRGLGLAEHNDALYCVGGFDGQSFLSSVERYSPSEGDAWTLTNSPLNVPRNNVGLVSLNGSIIAVGGFSGRHFLSSLEVVDDTAHEWTNHEIQAQKGVPNDTATEND